MDLTSFYEIVQIDTATSGDNTLVDISSRLAALAPNLSDISKKRIYIINYLITGFGDVDVTFKSGSTEITPNLPLATKGNYIGNTSTRQFPLLICNKAEDLIINLSDNIQVVGTIGYMIE